METAQHTNGNKFIPIKQAAQLLGVSVETLLDWNDSNILKPIISQEGVIGYTNYQLDKFVSLQKMFRSSSQYNQSENNAPIGEYNRSDSIRNEKTIAISIGTQSDRKANKKNKDNISYQKLTSIGIGSAITVILISVIISGLPFIVNTNTVGVHDNPPSRLTNAISGEQSIKNNNNSESISAPDSEITSPFNSINTTSSSDSPSVVTAPKVPTELKEKSRIGSLTSSASRANIGTNQENGSVIDEHGNIQGETLTANLLSTSVGSGLLRGEQNLYRPSGISFVVILIVTGSILIIYFLHKQPAYAPAFQVTNAHSYHAPQIKTQSPKVLEVDQKTDGTVVLYIQGYELKISKPEFNSETDRLIQRLLGLAKDEEKTIRYDILKDEKLQLNAPLSKIVTRLGFVGLKRDLFFPRTSKSKVIFRKYITDEDLVSMDLSIDEIKNELMN